MVKSSWLKKAFQEYSYWLTKILCIIFLIGAALFFARYWIMRSGLVERYATKLTEIAGQKRDEIINAIDEQRNKSFELAHNAEFIANFKSLSAVFDPEKTTDDYKKEEAKLDQFFNQYRSQFNYKDILFIQTNGTIFYSNKIDVLGERNLLAILDKSLLGQSFDRTRMTLTVDLSEFGTGPIVREPALFILEPIFADDVFLGVLAVWIDENILYKIIQNYENLGKTGDIFVTKRIGDRELFVAPSRLYSNVVFKKITNPDKYVLTPAGKASLGYEGNGLIIDSFNVEIVSSWLYIPQLDWGLSIGIQMPEIAQPLKYIKIIYQLLLLFAFICLLGILFKNRHSHAVKRTFSYMISAHFLRIIFWLAFIVGIVISGALIWQYKETYNTIFKGTKELAESKIHTEANFIEQQVIKIEKIGQMLAKDLQSGSLARDDIKARITRDLKDLADVSKITIAYAPFAFDAQKRLYALEAKRNGSLIDTNELTIDYMIPGLKNEPETGWYDRAIKQGAFWSETFFNPSNKQHEVLYVLPFYKKDSQEIAGVIAITYQLDKIIMHLRALEIGKTGYAVLLSSNGTFIYHPLQQYVKDRKNILDIAREQNSQQLKDIVDEIKKGKTGFKSYSDASGQLQHWIAFEHIPSVKWTIAALFSQESLDLPTQEMHKQAIWILISIVLSLLILTVLISHLEWMRIRNIRIWSILSSLLFAGALITFWYIVRKAPYQPRSDVTTVRDQASLDKYIEFLILDAQQRNEKQPIVVPTGIILHTLSFPDSSKVTLSGYVWQKFKKDMNVVHGVRFPEAAESDFKEVIHKMENDYEIIGWNMSATFLQKHRYSWFPFDRVHVDILIASADFEENVILVPDFSSYQSLEIDPLPGITNKIEIPGFALDRSFFSFLMTSPDDEVGLEKLKQITEKPRLHYNIILERKLTNPFIIFFFPLLVILFSIYAVFIVAYRSRGFIDVFKSLGAYTAIFFSLVILHQMLRSQYQAGELLYLEYFFFFTYFTILLLILHSILIRVTHFSNFIRTKISPYLRIFFWPVQMALWFAITMIIFYKLR